MIELRERVESEYLTFSRSPVREVRRKTRVWIIRAKRTDAFLGEISWFGRWRQYAFHPNAPTTFNDKCLREIADFCEIQTKLHLALAAEARRLAPKAPVT